MLDSESIRFCGDTPVEIDGKKTKEYWLSDGEVGHIMCALRTYHNLCADSGAWCSICEEIEAKLCGKPIATKE